MYPVHTQFFALLYLRLLVERLLLYMAQLRKVVSEPVDHVGLGLEEGGEEIWLLGALLEDLLDILQEPKTHHLKI